TYLLSLLQGSKRLEPGHSRVAVLQFAGLEGCIELGEPLARCPELVTADTFFARFHLVTHPSACVGLLVERAIFERQGDRLGTVIPQILAYPDAVAPGVDLVLCFFPGCRARAGGRGGR